MERAKVMWKQLTIPSYQLKENDKNPTLDGKMPSYPYPMQNHFAKESVEKTYRAVLLENEYIRMMVLPELGGRLYSAQDLRSGKEIFYKNTVIRPRLIGTRGAWFSGGVEYNFPISHSPTTSDEVSAQLYEYEDGSASVRLGSTELITGMQWQVELLLRPGTARIEQKVTLYNPTANENRFYFWTNAAVEYNKSLELVYPFDWCINYLTDHYLKWPEYKGINCQNAREITIPFETFGKLLKENFFGVYNHQDDYGVIHYADRKRVKGAKFFIWGNSPYADAWNAALTDDDSQYIEIQSGPFETQAVFHFMKPHQRMTWKEYWCPIFETQGFRYAEKEVAVNYDVRDGELFLKLMAFEPLKDCRITVQLGKEAQVIPAELMPERPIEFKLPVDSCDVTELKLDIVSGGQLILSMGRRDECTGEYPDHTIFEDSRIVRKDDGQKSLLQQGILKESLGKTGEAIALYRQNLMEHPDCTQTLYRLGNLCSKTLRLDEAEACLVKALGYHNRDNKARFALAHVFCQQGRLAQARRLFLDIPQGEEFFDASVLEAVKLDLALGYYKDALNLLEEVSPYSNYEVFLKSLALRKSGSQMQAHELRGLIKQPDLRILAECYLSDSDTDTEEALLASLPADENILLRLALEYVEVGQREDAATLLELSRSDSVKIRLAKLLTKPEAEITQEDCQAALNASLDYVFLNEEILVRLLKKLQMVDKSGRSDYLLGNYAYHCAMEDKAKTLFEQAYRKGLRYTALLRNLGMMAFTAGDYQAAECYFFEDVQKNGTENASTLLYLHQIYQRSGSPEQKEQLYRWMEENPNRPLVLPSMLTYLLESGRTDEALRMMESEEFENWEGGEISGSLYRETILRIVEDQMEQGDYQKAEEWLTRVRQYPKKLNYGESVHTPLSDVYYYEGCLALKLGDFAKARKCFVTGGSESEEKWLQATPRTKRYSRLCLEKLQKM